MMICPACNATIKAQAKFCPICGIKVRIPLSKNKSEYLIQFASFLLLVQNSFLTFPALVLLAMLLSDVAPIIFYSIISMLFYLDIIGFSLLGIGYVTYKNLDNDKRKMYLISGICIILWVICRFLWQFILTGNLVGNLYDYLQTPSGAMGIFELFAVPLDTVKIPFLIGSLTLCVATIVVFRTTEEAADRWFMIYGINNLIAVLLIFLPLILFPIFESFITITEPGSILGLFVLAPYFGLFIKLIIIPVLGALAFLKLVLKYT
jgi:hypothetical protein